MKTYFSYQLSLLASVLFFSSCGLVDKIEEKARVINNYEKVAMELAKENRILQAKLGELEANIQKLETQNNYLTLKLQGKSTDRKIASVKPSSVSDKVDFGTYKWTPGELVALAKEEYRKKDFKTSAEYFVTLLENFPQNQMIDDEVLFQLGLASYESKLHYDWSIKYLDKLIQDYPTSKYFREAKLWRGLSLLKVGEEKKFYQVVDEFRLKYRNTPEWKILSKHYEEFTKKYK